MPDSSKPTRVSLWQFPLNVRSDPQFVELLSADEVDRANRFHREADRHRWVAARVSLRRTLSECVGVHPGELRFRYGSNGKPALANPLSGRLEFNISHTDDLVVMAVSEQCPVGVDVEPVREIEDLAAISQLSLSSGERKELFADHKTEWSRRFLKYWTSKEAVLKAQGRGLSELGQLDLHGPDVKGGPDEGWRRSGAEAWQVVPIQFSATHVGAVAVVGIHVAVEVALVNSD